MNKLPDWLMDNALQQLFAVTQAAGGTLRAVGGAVRDHLLGRAVGDVDFACTLLPETMMQLAVAQGWKAVPTGIAHGTVTVIIAGKPYEVTTLRRDIETDGRHAKVTYTEDFAEDAARRDFTINALYMDAHGAVVDPTGQGLADLNAQRLRFIGEARQRITEDALRILRYFRFVAQLGWQVQSSALDACRAERRLLEQLSGERIQQEMKKLLGAAQPSAAAQAVQQLGIAVMIAHAPWDVTRLESMLQYAIQHDVAANPWARLVALGCDAEFVIPRWKLSRAEQAMLRYFSDAAKQVFSDAQVKEQLRAHPRDLVLQALLLQTANTRLLALARDWAVPVFPVTAKDLLARGMQQGPALGGKLQELEQRWVESDYALTKDALLHSAL